MYVQRHIMDINEILVSILICIWVFIPAMIPNSAAVFTGGWGPIDFGKSWRGKRILGDGKTWSGLIGGGLFGVLFGLGMIGISALFGSTDYWGFGPFWDNVGILFCLSFGALFGDMLGSFIKRRIGIDRGKKAPLLDQYDFVIGAFLLVTIFYHDWVYSTFIAGYNWIGLIVMLILVWFIHRSVSILGYKLGLKDVPW